jgi:beta-lactamase superfamily II metal-dependent hydrolase
VSFVLTGDAEAENWATIATRLPPSIRVFQVPHHGGRNGTFGPGDITPWLDLMPAPTQLALSSHIRPHGHPHADVVNVIGARNFVAFRTDLQSHLTFSTDGTKVEVKYSHV